jgi:tetratricopeptide (TPR) repeat protein
MVIGKAVSVESPSSWPEFQKVVELRPEDGDAYYNLGVIYAEHLPDRERAMANFRRYLQLKPGADDATWVKQYIASWQAWEGKERLE